MDKQKEDMFAKMLFILFLAGFVFLIGTIAYDMTNDPDTIAKFHKAPTPLTIPQRVALVQMNIFCPINNNHPLYHDKEVCVYVPHLKEIIK